jgi:hypothetical protein
MVSLVKWLVLGPGIVNPAVYHFENEEPST